MTIVATVIAPARRKLVPLLLVCLPAVALVVVGGPASAAVVATVPLGTTAGFAVLGGSTVTNTGNSVLHGSLGLSPGSSITGFPPGQVVAPGTIHAADAVAAQAQSDLTAAYVNAAGRPVDGTTTAELGNLHLQAGVYAGPSKSALHLTGTLTLDGAGDANSVFILQTDSTLITSSGSTVNLVNGAQECRVFWQVGSSATLGTNSVFRGNVLALTSITVTTNVTVHGRALARNAAVTLDDDTFTTPTCAQAAATTTTTAVPGATTTTTADATTTTVVGAAPGATTTTMAGAAPSTSATTAPPGNIGQGGPGGGGTASGAPSGPVPTLPRTGVPVDRTVLMAVLLLTTGVAAIRYSRKVTTPGR